MRGFWIGVGALAALGCGGGFSDAPGGGAGHGGHGGAGHAGVASAGRAPVAESGWSGSTGGSGGVASAGGSSVAGRASAAGQGGEATGDVGGGGESAGAPSDEAGAGGQPSATGGSGGKVESAAGKAGVGGAGVAGCDCDAAHDCVGGECVIKPECDCGALGVECSPLSVALNDTSSCPLDIDCGKCNDDEFCEVPFNKPLQRTCRPNGLCSPSHATCPGDGPPQCTFQIDCGVQYPTIVLPKSGDACSPGCGPQVP